MSVEIQFIKGKKETSLPIIKLTKSVNGKTGTATFLFIYPDVFNLGKFQNYNSMSLLWDNKEINYHKTRCSLIIVIYLLKEIINVFLVCGALMF